VIRTFVELTLRTTRNRIVYRLRRLRDPRYLIGAIAGFGYLWLMFFRNTRGAHGKQVVLLTGDLIADFMGVVILALMILAWALPSDSGGLQFSEAEIAFLFPAPLRRRDLLLYKIIRAQPQALGSAIAFFIFGWRRSWLIGTWAALSVLGIYFIFVALARARLKLMHIGFIARLLIVSVVLTGLVSLAVSDIVKNHPLVLKGKTGPEVIKQLHGAFYDGAIGAVLFVPRLFATAASPPSLAQMATSIAALAVLGAILFLLAVRMNISFEEASIVHSARRAARIDRLRARQSGRMRVSYRRLGSPFKLGEAGWPETAIVWKNVIALMRTAFGIVILLLVMAALLLGFALYQHDAIAYKVIGGMFLFMAAFFPLSGPQLFANDLRLDLARSEILKSYPIVGERLVAAELAAPLVVITALEVLFAGCGSLLLQLSGTTERFGRLAATPEFAVTVLVLTLPVCAMLLLIRNAVPLYFPAWSLRPADDVRSFVNVGQRIVVLFANLFALFIALIPASIVFLPTAFIAYKFFSASAVFVPVATVPAAMVICIEVWFGIKLLGARFDAMDVSNEFDLVSV
jgi:ABC-2 type transport system permease protein